MGDNNPNNPDPILTEDNVQTIKDSLRARKGHLTRALGLVVRDQTFDRDTNSKGNYFADRYKNTLVIVRDRFQKVENAYSRLKILDEDNEETYETQQNADEDRFLQARDDLQKLIANALGAQQAQPQNAVAEGNNLGRNQPLKAAQDLKPPVLEESMTPQLFADWKARIQNYFNANGLVQRPAVEQQQYARAFISPSLWADLETHVEAEMHVIAEAPADGAQGGDPPRTLLDLVEDEYKRIYPLVTRRLNLFRKSQRSDQSALSFCMELKRDLIAADARALQENDILTCLLIKGIKSQALRKELLENFDDEGNCEFRTLEQEIRKFESMSRTSDFVTGKEQSNAYKLSSYKKEKRNSRIEKDSKVTCSFCKKKNHSSDECFSNPKSKNYKGNSKERGRSSSRQGRSKSFSPSPSRSSSKSFRNKSKGGQKTKVNQVSTVSAIYGRMGSHPTPLIAVSLQQDYDPRFKGPGEAFEHEICPDSGCTRTVVNESVARDHGLWLSEAKNEILKNASGKKMRVSGAVKLRTTWKGTTVIIDALVSPDLKGKIILLSWHDMENLGMINLSKVNQIEGKSAKKAKKAAEKRKQHSSTMQQQHLPPPQKSDEEYIKVYDVNRKGVILNDSLDKILEDFSDVISDTLPEKPMKGGPMHIYIDKEKAKLYPPVRVLTARPHPVHLEEKCKANVQNLLDQKIIAPATEPSDEIYAGFHVLKANGDVRLVVDLSPLCRKVKRPVHPFVPACELIKRIPYGTTHLCVLDCQMGYHQIELDEESQNLTTFLLPFGRFKYLRGVMGLSSTSDEFTRRTSSLLGQFPFVLQLIDDHLLHAKSEQQLFQRMRMFLLKCRENNVGISRKKLQCSSESVIFAGHKITPKGVMIEDKKLDALQNFPTPTCQTDIRSLYGLITQMQPFWPDIAQVAEPLKPLLKKHTIFNWCKEHDDAFKKVKAFLCSPPILSHFNPNKQVTLWTDASRKGLGFSLTSSNDTGDMTLLACGSRTLTKSEVNMGITSLEFTALVWSVKKCSYWLRGCNIPFIIKTDHSALRQILTTKEMSKIVNPRQLRLREQMLGYNYIIEVVKGKALALGDVFSRAPVWKPEEEDQQQEEYLTANVANCIQADEKTAPYLEALQGAAKKDENYQKIVTAVQEKRTFDSLESTHPGRAYSNIWNDISIDGHLMIYNGSRIIVPSEMIGEILRKLHLPHCGTQKTLASAKQLFWWRFMARDIQNLCTSCIDCSRLQNSNPREFMQPQGAEGPMSELAGDLFHLENTTYLTIVCRFSSFPWCFKLKGLDSKSIISCFKEVIHEHGRPGKIRSDFGPQFRGPFEKFCTENEIDHEISSPYMSMSNGYCELQNKLMKSLLIKSNCNWDKFKDALLEFRNVPRAADGLSPAFLFSGRRQRTALPALQNALDGVYADLNSDDEEEASNCTMDKNKKKLSITPLKTRKKLYKKRMEKSKLAMRKRGGRKLSILKKGDRVLVQNKDTKRWSKRGTVDRMRQNKRIDHGFSHSYYIDLDEGGQILRNRRFIRPFNPKRPKYEQNSGSVDQGGEMHAQDAPIGASAPSKQKPCKSAISGASKEEESTRSQPRRSPRLNKKQVRFLI